MNAIWLTAIGGQDDHEELGCLLATGDDAGTACRAHRVAATGGVGILMIGLVSEIDARVCMHACAYPGA